MAAAAGLLPRGLALGTSAAAAVPGYAGGRGPGGGAVPPAAIEQAITTQGPAADTNLEAFRWGRWMVADPDAVATALAGAAAAEATGAGRASAQRSTWDPTPGAATAALIARAPTARRERAAWSP